MRSFIMRAGGKFKSLIGRDQEEEEETDPSPLAESYVPREDVQVQIAQRLDGDDTLFHVAGEPGVGKTFLLDWVEDEFGDEYSIERVELGSHHSVPTVGTSQPV